MWLHAFLHAFQHAFQQAFQMTMTSSEAHTEKVYITRESDGYVDEIRRTQTEWPVVGTTKR